MSWCGGSVNCVSELRACCIPLCIPCLLHTRYSSDKHCVKPLHTAYSMQRVCNEYATSIQYAGMQQYSVCNSMPHPSGLFLCQHGALTEMGPNACPPRLDPLRTNSACPEPRCFQGFS